MMTAPLSDDCFRPPEAPGWERFGTGPRRVIGAHCVLARARVLGPMVQALGGRVTLVAHDLPGHGRAADWQGGSYLDEALAPLLPLLRAPGPQVDLFGHSFGGIVALALAQAAPERVRSLTLVEPVLFAALRGDASAWAACRAEAAPAAAALARGDAEAAARAFTGRWGNGTPWAALPAHHQAYFTGRIGLLPAIAAVNEADSGGLLAPGALEALRMPVLLLAGEAAPPSIPPVLAALAARLPDARLARLAGAGHMAPLTHPAAVAAAFGAFLDAT